MKCPHCSIFFDNKSLYTSHIEKCCHQMHLLGVSCKWCPPPPRQEQEPEIEVALVEDLDITLSPEERTKALEELIDKWISADLLDMFF